MPVIDASVFGRLLFDEPGAPVARDLISGSRTVGPPSLRVELVNLVRRAARIAGWDSKRAAARLDDLCEGVEFVPDSAELGQAALAHAMDLDHTAQDCAYLAVASLRGLPLVTADAAFARKARAKGHDVRVL